MLIGLFVVPHSKLKGDYVVRLEVNLVPAFLLPLQW